MKLSNTMGTVLRTTLWALLLLGGSLCIHLLTYSTFVANNDLDHQRVFNEGYKVFSLTLPNELTFCDEKVPLNRLDVREKLEPRPRAGVEGPCTSNQVAPSGGVAGVHASIQGGRGVVRSLQRKGPTPGCYRGNDTGRSVAEGA